MIHPTKRPTTTAQDFMIGDPNLSQRMIVKKTEKPSPMNWADPHGKGYEEISMELFVRHFVKTPDI